MTSPAARVASAFAALAAYQAAKGYVAPAKLHPEDLADAITDLAADLGHLLAERGGDPAALYRKAADHVAAEAPPPAPAEPPTVTVGTAVNSRTGKAARVTYHDGVEVERQPLPWAIIDEETATDGAPPRVGGPPHVVAGRFASEAEAVAWLEAPERDAAKVARGGYGIDGPGDD